MTDGQAVLVVEDDAAMRDTCMRMLSRAGYRADSVEAGGARVGDIGIAMTFLRPSGKVKIKDDIFDVITEGEFMEKGTPVKVSEIKGNRIIVSRKPEDE